MVAQRLGDVSADYVWLYLGTQIKKGSRQKKIDLINAVNPEWRDLSEEL